MAEGQPGFDKEVYARAMQKAKAMLSWYLDNDGTCYQSIKGWLNISAFVAAAHRDPSVTAMHDLLCHLWRSVALSFSAARPPC